ncbi:MAG TPA: hypothetical protein VNN20_06125 [Thermodesulfobacteriota bacterium]|nr:hypothetical protein [Thermodesulfobacteriota bacterium]
MKPILLCILLGMNPAYVAKIPYVFKSQSVEFARGHIFACVKDKVEKPELLIEKDLSNGTDAVKKKKQEGGN